jgi:tetratricopeptide (TPR) repeat protein
MKLCSYRLCGPALSALLLLLASVPAVMRAQDKPASGRSIDLDRELRKGEPQNRARSYYYYALAKWSEDKGDLTRAVGEMRNALKYNESSSSVRVELAGILEKAGNLKDAIEEAREAARLDPKSPEPHWLLANIYFRTQGRDRATARESLTNAVKELEAMREVAPDDERAYYALGGAYFELEQPEKAIQAFEKFQSLAPSMDAGYVAIAKYYERAKNDEKAIEYLKMALKAQPDSAESLMMLATLYGRTKHNKEAIPLYRKILELTGDNPGIKRQLANSMVEAEEYDDAVEILKDLTSAAPGDREARIMLGRAQIGARQFDEAVELLKSLVEDSSGDIEAEFYLATAYEQSGKSKEAAEIFTRLLQSTDSSEEQKANRPVFEQHLAAVYQDMGEHEKAIALYEEMLKNQPEPRPGLVFMLINAYRVNRQLDKALNVGKQYYEKNPKDVNIGLVYARALADAGKTREAADLLLKLLQSDPSNIDIYVNLSQVYLQGKRFSDAERVLRRAEDRQLDSERVKFQLATVFERQKDFDKAEVLFKEVLKANPKNATALNYIGYMLADRGVRLQEAVKYVEEALALDPNNGAYLDSLGWAFYKLNELDKAEQYLLRAVELVKNDPVIHDHLGDVYFKGGNYEKAVQYWTKSVEVGTEPEETQKVREKLDKLQDSLRKQKHR